MGDGGAVVGNAAMTSSSGLSGLDGRRDDHRDGVAPANTTSAETSISHEAAVPEVSSIEPTTAAAPSRPTTPPPQSTTETAAEVSADVAADAAAASRTTASQSLGLVPQTPDQSSRDAPARTAPSTPPTAPLPPTMPAGTVAESDNQRMRDAPAHSDMTTPAAVAQRPEFTTPVAQKTSVDASVPADEPMPDAPQQIPSGNASESALQQAAVILQNQQHDQSHHSTPATPMNNENTPFTPGNMSNTHAFMMMALANMSDVRSAMSHPPTVTPSQVTLPNLADDEFDGHLPGNSLHQAAADKGLESFARIEFADSVFQMTTYAVKIGRDQSALEQARRDEKRSDEHRRRVEDNASKGLPPPSPMLHDHSKFSKSYVSEEGGMLGPESDSEDNGLPNKRRKTSTTGSSQNDDESQENVISNRQYVSHTPGAAAVDLTSLRASPWHVPFIAIHSPGPNIARKTKAISREHLKISYNQQEAVFEAIPLHKNGFFCEDVHYKSDKVVLKCGDRLQIKDIDFRFIINGVERGCTGAEEVPDDIAPAQRRRTQGGKEMSFDFEQSHGNGEIQDTSDELSEMEMSPVEPSDLGEDDDGDEEGEEVEEVEEADEEGSELKNGPEPQPESSIPLIPKKRGPGRPPKNGFMSKREQRLLKKQQQQQQQEMVKKEAAQAPVAEPPIKRKVGRPRKHPLPEDGGDRPEKRKYKPRKPKNEEGGEGSDAERRAKEKKDKKARPKSPALNLQIDQYTEEQLLKPNKNYGVLIDEALTAAGPDGLTLKQIYKRICEGYPWFFFHAETKGWESSVRHNLIGNEAFKKDDATNLWYRVPGVELDAGKKRKASSPDRGLAAQGYGPYSYPYNTQQHAAPGAAPGFPPTQVPPGYHMPGYNGQPGQPGGPVPPQYGHSASPPVGAPPPKPVAAQPPPAPTQLPGYGPPPAPARPQLGVPQPGAYSSPYASRPPPPANPPVKTEDGSVPPVVAAAAPAPHPPPPAAVAPAATPGSASVPRQSPALSRPSATPPANVQLRPVIDPRLLSAVAGLKNGLVENLKKARNPKAEAIVMSALNRCVGLKKEATENDKMEAICIKGIRQVIDGFTNTKSPTPAGSSTPQQPEAPPPVFDIKVLASLNGFKDVSVEALKGRLGVAKAEAVTLSAIDRVVGLADASIVPTGTEGETSATGGSTANLEGLEQHLIRSIRKLLMGMNQRLASPATPARAQRA